MAEQIVQSIVMFLLGAVLSYFSTRWSTALKKITVLEVGVQALLRDRMLFLHKTYAKSGQLIPQKDVENFESMYSAYKGLGGNGYMEDVHKVFIEEMPHEKH